MKKLLLASAAAAALGMGSQAFAQDCSGNPGVGSMAASQTCSTDLTLTVVDVVAVSGLEATQTIPYVVGTGADVNIDIDFCLATNAASGDVQITGTSDNGAAGVFYVSNGTPADDIVYVPTVELSPLTESLVAIGIAAPNTLIECTDGGTTESATLNIAMTEADQALAPAGIYTDTLTLLVAPN